MNIKGHIKEILISILTRSLEKALKDQNLKSLKIKLEEIVPDITNQYSEFKLDTQYLGNKARNMHTFQISLVNSIIDEIEEPVIVDVGDSAGTHLQYILALYSKNKKIKCFSLNLDPEAIKRIKKRGLEAIEARAENLKDYNINADIFLCFEILEHLMNPCSFLYQLSSDTKAKYLIMTVPYLKASRTGLHHIRKKREIDRICAENTHIFELSPEDWRLIVQHSGWSIIDEKIYFQYPKRGLFWMTKLIWKRFDYEGFYGLVLKKDNTWSSKYLDW